MLNHITIMGRLTKEPEIRYTQSNKPVASLTIAVDRDYQSGGEKQTDFINCVAWRQTAEFIQKHFHKGSMAVVDGSLQSRQWTDKHDSKRTEWEVNISNIYFGESKKTPNPNVDASEFTEISEEESGDLLF